ncbi:MAG: VWA domain-containing protein, partial [Byssovorax sp.]
EELHRTRLARDESAKHPNRDRRPVHLDEATLRALRQQAEREAAAKPRDADAAMLATWGDRARAWAEIADVFGDLGELMGRGWDMSLGVLRRTGWLDLLRLRDLVKQLPELREIVRALGRLRSSSDEASVAETILLPVRRLEEERLEVRTPHIPAETRGVERSGEIARMLPIEASMLGHPKLRLLWHARRAERALLTYRVEGIETERVWVEREAQIEGRKPRLERGPIVAVIDTSGSMHGLPELVAKALVLETLRTAHSEKRRCFLYAYSGPTQVLDHELALSADGIGNLLAFLGFSFGGGNDETGVMARVIARLDEEGWKKADVIWVSDGEWPAPAGLIASAQHAREAGTRFHGVQIGNRGQTGLHAICDPVHVFESWTAAAGWSR